jgi:protein TonB
MERPPEPRGQVALALGLTLALHVLVILAWPKAAVRTEAVEFGVESADSSVEVALVAALPAEEPVAEQPPDEVPPTPREAVPEPTTEPPPPVMEKEPEMAISGPAPVPKPAPPQPKPKLQKPVPPKPARPARVSGDGSSAVPGNDATTAQVSAGALTSKPGYLRNPHPAYPEEARSAGQQGTVTLSVQVTAQGSVGAVRITRSSGFPLLDERARSTVADRWAFKPAKAGGVPIASEVIIPIRFTLNR